MIFAEFDIDECLGAVLAHSRKLGGKRIAKGRVLDAALIEAFRREGITSLVCARPEKGDRSEDEVASQIAQKLAEGLIAEDIEVSIAATGRVNFKTRKTGIIRYDRNQLRAFNMVHEGVGLSLPAHNQLVSAGQFIATLKVIPFFLHRDVVEKLLAVPGDAPLFTFHALTTKKAALIQTYGHALPDKVYQATETVTRNRLEALGSQLMSSLQSAHQTEALTRQINSAIEQGAEIVLMCGGSAIVDRQDVIPSAICQLGGQIDQLGLAVDPGNMLMTASIGGVPVIGMPGCARSPKLNGFDWVLQLLLAGIPLDRETLADLAAGGLLNEIASRPMPRIQAEKQAHKKAETPQKMACILLAAGQSRRMGGTNKLLMEIRGKPVIRHAAEALIQAGLGDIYVVTGHQPEQLQNCLNGLDVTFVHNPDYASGQASSVAQAISVLPEGVSDALIALGDMPLMKPALLTALARQHQEKSGTGLPQITLPTYQTEGNSEMVRRGNPVIWSSPFFAELKGLSGDQGGRQILADYPACIQQLHWPDPHPFMDVDTGEAFAEVVRYFSYRDEEEEKE